MKQGKVRLKQKTRTKATPTGQGETKRVPAKTSWQIAHAKATTIHDRIGYVIDRDPNSPIGKPDRRKEEG